MRTVYIQRGDDGEILNYNVYTAYAGFKLMLYDIRFFTGAPEPESRDDIVCGGIGTVKAAWRHLGIEAPAYVDYPDALLPYLGRRVWRGTLGEVRQNLFSDNPQPVFVKPLEEQKLFTGLVMHSPKCLNSTTYHAPETPVWLSEPVRFTSEYRVFIKRGQIIGAKNYTGNFEQLIDFAVVRAAVTDFREAPTAYALDFGVTEDGRTLLIEVNDGFALGCYGLPPFAYAKFVEARWDEVTGSTLLAEQGM